MTHTCDNTHGNQTSNTFKAALEARRPAIDAMAEADINRRIRLDVVSASETIATALGNIDDEVRGALVAEFGERASKLMDGLETTSRAARQADVALGTMEESSDLAAIHKEVMGAYERLITDADSLVLRGFLPKERLAGSRDLKGYQATLQSLLGVIEVLREFWPSIASETPVKKADLDRADEIAARMADTIGKRQHGVLRAAAVETRTRALSLLVREYEMLRRMVTFVRWFEGDYDRIMPSLYAGRGGRGKKDVEPAVDDDGNDGERPVAPVVGPSPNNGGPPFVS